MSGPWPGQGQPQANHNETNLGRSTAQPPLLLGDERQRLNFKSRTSSLISTTAWMLPQRWTERAPSTATWNHNAVSTSGHTDFLPDAIAAKISGSVDRTISAQDANAASFMCRFGMSFMVGGSSVRGITRP
jgi:hypothetical protein